MSQDRTGRADLHVQAPRGRSLRPLAWVALTVAAIAAIELCVGLIVPSDPYRRTNFLDYRFKHEADAARIIADLKLRLFGHSEPTILQVGDSSGFHGVHPPIVEKIVGVPRYVNMNVFAFGFPGYLEMARHVLERNTSVKVLVLYITIATPAPEFDTETTYYGADIWREFNSGLYQLAHLPSLALRKDVLRELYGWRGDPSDALRTEILTRYPDAMALIPQSDGWEREHDVPDDVARGPFGPVRKWIAPGTTDEQAAERFGVNFAAQFEVFDWLRLERVNLAVTVFDRFRALAEQHGVKLVISLAPQAELFITTSVGQRIARFNAMLDSYKAAHPEVGVIKYVYWPTERFSSSEHLATPYTVMNTIRFAQALKAEIGPIDASEGDAPRRTTVSTISMDKSAPVYGFSPADTRDGSTFRAIRAGRDEGLVYANVDPAASRLVMDLAGPLPPELRTGLGVAVYGEPARLLSEEAGETGARLTWALPPAARLYGGWLEILVSTRGRTTWPGNDLREDAIGPRLRVTRLHFE